MSHRKSDLGIPRPRKSAKVVLERVPNGSNRKRALDSFTRSHFLRKMFYAPLLLLERAVGNDGAALDAAEPSEREIVALPRDGNGAIGTPSAFVGLALGDDLDEEDVGLRLPDAGELAGAVEVRIFRLGAFGRDRELEFVGRLAADLIELAGPIASDGRARDWRPLLVFPPGRRVVLLVVRRRRKLRDRWLSKARKSLSTAGADAALTKQFQIS